MGARVRCQSVRVRRVMHGGGRYNRLNACDDGLKGSGSCDGVRCIYVILLLNCSTLRGGWGRWWTGIGEPHSLARKEGGAHGILTLDELDMIGLYTLPVLWWKRR